MAKDKCVINVTASVLPDAIKTGIGGTTVYNVNDIGSANRWFYYRNLVDGTNQVLVPTGQVTLGDSTGDETASIGASTDAGLIINKHTGLIEDGTKCAASAYINFNTKNGAAATTGAGGTADMRLEPGEVWWGRFCHKLLTDCTAICNSGSVLIDVWALVDVAGV